LLWGSALLWETALLWGRRSALVWATESVWGSEMASESLKRPLSVWIGVVD
jgi:hypothetical protein